MGQRGLTDPGHILDEQMPIAISATIASWTTSALPLITVSTAACSLFKSTAVRVVRKRHSFIPGQSLKEITCTVFFFWLK